MRRLSEHQLTLALKKMPEIFSLRAFWDEVNNNEIKISEYKIRRFIKENCKKYDRFRWRKKNEQPTN